LEGYKTMSQYSDAELPPLPYDYDALEPHISEQVLTWHHDTHHQGYVNGLNAAEETLAENREAGDFGSSGAAIRNVTHNGCGHYLHHLFWRNMSPDGGGEPDGALRDRIEEDFGSYEGWKGEFEAAAGAAGGWALLVYDPVAKQLRNLVVDKHDQGALWGAHPILALDVWEHSYYYDYGPDRGSFVDAFFEVVDWDTVAEEYEKTTSNHE
jgi:Fe-Mn family superoxide dismutase